jgi:LysM repeat protein
MDGDALANEAPKPTPAPTPTPAPETKPAPVAKPTAPDFVNEPPKAAPYKPNTGTPKSFKTVEVQQSQTLYSISKAHMTTVEALIEWNNLQSIDIKIGQKLKVPVWQ